jgi:hypothetical protein
MIPAMFRVRAPYYLSTLMLMLVPALAACGSSAPSGWHDIQSVTVTVSQPSLPPPGGQPQTSTFTSSSDIARVTSALNRFHIKQTPASSASGGCAGGFQIAITINEKGAAPVKLSAYRCADQTSGNVGGDLAGFLSAIGVNV